MDDITEGATDDITEGATDDITEGAMDDITDGASRRCDHLLTGSDARQKAPGWNDCYGGQKELDAEQAASGEVFPSTPVGTAAAPAAGATTVARPAAD